MNERVKEEQSASRIVPSYVSTHESDRVELNGIGVRIDPPHLPPVETQARRVEWQSLEHFVPAVSPQSAVNPPPFSPAAPIPADLPLDDWGQVALQLHAQIQSQRTNLEQQKRDLSLRLTRFDEEERRFREYAASEQFHLEDRKRQLQRNETEFAERYIDYEMKFRKFEAEREVVNHQRTELERRKVSLRDELLAEMQVERDKIDATKSLLDRELEQTQVLGETLKLRLESLAAENQQTLQAERDKLWQTLSAEWEQRNFAFQQEREKWITQRDHERSEFEREKEMFESTVAKTNAELVQARETLASELALSRDEHLQRLETEKSEWTTTRQTQESEWVSKRQSQEAELCAEQERQQAELAALRETHTAELIAERQAHDTDLVAQKHALASEVKQARDVFTLELDTERNLHQELLRAERMEWEQALAKHRSEMEAEKLALIAEREALILDLDALREQHHATLTGEREVWEEYRDREMEQMKTQHEDWLMSRDAMLAASREALEVEFIALREKHAEKLKAERVEWEETLLRETTVFEERKAEMQRERTLIENRIRFQQVHLDKMRSDLEQAQNTFRRERQIELQQLEETGMLMLRRVRQIDLYRSSIDEREKSLDRELEVFNRTRKALSSTADHDRMNFQAERLAWEQDRQNQQNELRRQQEVLVTKAESLESRRIRLDKLRAELEETHRSTLEMRLALEEAWSQLTQVAGQDESRQRVDQVRQSLTGFYQQMHETLAQQRHEHLDAQAKFERQRAEFTEERQKLTTWLTSRDDELRVGEERLRIAAMESAESHSKWLAARDRWLIEKTEAEQLIRRLLTSLGENNRELSNELGSIRRLGEMSAAPEEPRKLGS